MSTLKVSAIQNASSATANITLDTAGNATVGNTLAMGSSFLRNRLINGDMRIDQRASGASSTVTGGSGYFSCDRWQEWMSVSSKYSIQRSTTAPTGFINSLLATSLSAYSVLSTDSYAISQQIEGVNISDLAWGSANAKTITVSFWVQSSLTGTFGGAVSNSAVNRSYPFTYSISAANTWEQKTITIAGDTTGTWLTDTGIGIRLWFSIGAGSNYLGTAGTWAAADYRGASGQTSVVGTNGATFYITGVQLEVGSVATPFERRQYGQELALCQRYYYKFTPAGASSNTLGTGFADSSTSVQLMHFFPCTMRTNPTALSTSGTASDYAIRYTGGANTVCNNVPQFSDANTTNATFNMTLSSAGPTGGQCVAGRAVNTNAILAWSAEL